MNQQLEILHEASVQFDSDLPEFRYRVTILLLIQTLQITVVYAQLPFRSLLSRTQEGVHRHADAKVVTAPPLMWVKAVDMVLERLRLTGIDFTQVRAISGSGQQHGSVFWTTGALKVLQSLNPAVLLHKQLDQCFALRESPVWMDSSTTAECGSLERSVGGQKELAEITGSRAYERFTGSQIIKIKRTRADVYENTERISLVSSFAASLFLGSYAAIDLSDGSGMNLLNIRTREWDERCLNVCASDLKDKLGDPVPSGFPLGPISRYFVDRYGFSHDCIVASFTGDNPASLVGMCLRDGDIAVSLGTSDTVFLWLDNPQPDVTGHILCNPLAAESFMALLCYKNGSITRERIARESAEGDWSIFSELLDSTPRGNFGNIGFYFDLLEIHPLVAGDFRFNKFDERVARFSKEVEVRACVEGQFMRLRAHAQDLGYTITPNTRILATGGASANRSILQVLSDVFNAPVYVQEKPNSAAAGGAFLARFADKTSSFNVQELTSKAGSYSLAASPAKDVNMIYAPMIQRYRKLELAIQQRS